MPRPTFRPGLLALAIALAVPAPFLHAAPAEQASVRDYRIAAGPLAGTLNRIAAQAGLVLTLDPALAEGRSAHAVQGRFDAPGALREALKGSGLELVENVGGTYSLRKVPEDTLSLQAMTVSGAEEDPLGPTSGYVAKRSMTGTKTDTPILETPRSISVATRQQMTDRAVHNLDDAVRYMPGVVASSFGSDTRSDWLKVRGFKPTQFLDGLPMAVGVYNNPKLETWNLERVALLRGPASSVYGQTPPGGMLDMVSLRPQNVASHEVKAEVGNYNHKQVSFDSTGPLDDEGRFLYRVSGVVRDSNTQVDHIDDKRYNIAPSLTWNIDDDTRLTFLGQFNRDDTGITSQFLPLRGTKYDAPFGKVSHHKNLGDPDWEYYDRTYYWLGYAFEQRINDVWQFRQNLRYLRNDLSFQAVTAGTAHADGTLERSTTSVDEDVSQFVVDNNFQADFETGALRHTLLLGLDHNRTDNQYTSIFGSAPPSNVNNPIYGQPIVKPDRSTAFYDYKQKTYQTGLYVQDQIALDNWRLTLGGREDWVHTGATFYNKGDATNTSRDKKFSGNAALSYIFDNGVAPYISYAESFQPTTGADMNSTSSLKPTEGKQWEIGVKYQPVGSDSLFTAAVYDLRQENVSVSQNIGGTPVTSQTGEVKVSGIELEATSNVTDNLKMIGAYSYADTEVKKGQYAGNRLQQAPRNQASLWADYTWHEGTLNGFSVGAGARYVGSTYGDQAVGAFDENPAVADVEQFDFSAANPQQAQAGRRHVFEVVPVAAALGAEVALDIVEQAPQQGLAGLLGLDFQQQPQVPVHRLGQPARVAFHAQHAATDAGGTVDHPGGLRRAAQRIVVHRAPRAAFRPEYFHCGHSQFLLCSMRCQNSKTEPFHVPLVVPGEPYASPALPAAGPAPGPVVDRRRPGRRTVLPAGQGLRALRGRAQCTGCGLVRRGRRAFAGAPRPDQWRERAGAARRRRAAASHRQRRERQRLGARQWPQRHPSHRRRAPGQRTFPATGQGRAGRARVRGIRRRRAPLVHRQPRLPRSPRPSQAPGGGLALAPGQGGERHLRHPGRRGLVRAGRRAGACRSARRQRRAVARA